MTTIYASGYAVPKVDDSKMYFMNRLTILYGPSGSGKSSLIQHILNTLRNSVPLAIVCCPTASLNGDYNNILPDQCIYDDVTKPLMQRIFQRQTNVMAMYELVHDVAQLQPIYEMIRDNESYIKVSKLAAIYKKGCEDIKNNFTEEEIENSITELTSKYNRKLVKILRACIQAKMSRLQSLPINDMQKTIINNFNINPRLFLLIDDCMASVKEWAGLEETKKLFYQGRHYAISVALSAQSEVSIPPPLRSNAHISIFTTQTIVNTFINKASSGIPPDQRKLISKIAETVFAPSEDRSKPNYKKLIIFGQIVPTETKIQYMIGSPKKRKFGSAALWRLCEEVKRESTLTINSNSFSKMFSLKNSPQTNI